MTHTRVVSLKPATATASYARRLQRLQRARWKRIFDVQAPYRWNIRRLDLGYVLDVGCGIGRNLDHLRGNGVGVDHNAEAVEITRSRGFTAYTTDEWDALPDARTASFDTLLLAHVVEHMSELEAVALVRRYRTALRPGGRVVFITPQEKGYRSDATHVRFVGFEELARLCEALSLRVETERSFPMPRVAGGVFRYNEFVVVSRLQD